MKNRIAILSILLLSVLVPSGCEKDEPVQGSSLVLLSGIALNFEAKALLINNQFSILFDFYDDKYLRLQFSIFDVPAAVGEYAISKNKVSGKAHSPTLFTFDDDLALDDYVLLDEADNTVSITEINTSTRWLYGTYQATFIRDTLLSPIKKDGFPDTIRLTEGVFWTPYMEK